jgi:hypothetical protein
VKEYDVFIPLCYNDGKPIESFRFQNLQARLLEHFDGLTYFPQPNQGFWKFGGMTYRDQIVIYRVITQDAENARRFLSALKQELKKDFQQEEILIIEREVGLL